MTGTHIIVIPLRTCLKCKFRTGNLGENVSIKHALPLGVVLPQTIEFVGTKNGSVMKIRFNDVESTNLVMKFLLGKVKKRMQKQFPDAFNSLLAGMQKLVTKISTYVPSSS